MAIASVIPQDNANGLDRTENPPRRSPPMGSIETSTSWLDELQLHHQTSNQRLVYEQMTSLENREMLLQVVKDDKDRGWEAILDRMSVLLCAKNIHNIKGRVLLQTSPRAAYDVDRVVTQARNYAREFDKVGISNDRFCIKIPCTAPGLIACRILRDEGIRTLGTSLFCLAQAIAASQAGCLSISPYYNLPWYHNNLKLWPNVKDPALDHPMSSRLVQILDAYRRMRNNTGREQPMLKPASFKSAREAMAMAELGCHNATIPEDIIQQLSVLDFDINSPAGGIAYKHTGTPSPRLAHLHDVDPLSGPNWNGRLASTEIDYLANDGAALKKAIADDAVTERGLKEALDAFEANELRCKVAIEEVMMQV
ncbi:hypothetical protein PRZ48_006755 [Zasmidium cellare]|uniref:Transaldolase n=1 Tax=Zasmidium cellare TaxID=395010 RepID=A0ABR0EHJ0_ZASCE|nr:hypothetical protein PRZ48_006755 [Zasmidium cellare]